MSLILPGPLILTGQLLGASRQKYGYDRGYNIWHRFYICDWKWCHTLFFPVHFWILRRYQGYAPMVVSSFSITKISGLRPYGCIIRFYYEEIRANAPLVYIIRFYFTKISGLRPYGCIIRFYYEEIRANAPLVYIIRFYFTKISGLRPYGCIIRFYYEDIRANAPMVVSSVSITKKSGLTPLWFISSVSILRRY
jgi:hypothetical protein